MTRTAIFSAIFISFLLAFPLSQHVIQAFAPRNTLISTDYPDIPDFSVEKLQTPTEISTAKQQILVKHDFIFLEQSRATINPDYISLVRPLDFSNMHSLLDKMTDLRNKHNNICSQMTDNAGNYTRFLFMDEYGDFTHASKVCVNDNMILPEIRSHEDTYALSNLMRNFSLTETHAGVYYSHVSHRLQYESIDDSAMNDFVIYKGDKSLREFTPYEQYNDDDKRWAHSYWKDSSQHMHLSPNVPEVLPIICQAPDIANDKLNKEAIFCQQRSRELDETIEQIKFSIQDLENNSHSTEPNHSPFLPKPLSRVANKTETFLQRTKRVPVIVAIGFFTLLISTISLLRAEAVYAKISKSMSALKINTEEIATELDRLSEDVYTSLDRLQTHAEYVRIEDNLYQAFIRLLMNVQDNALSFQQTIQAIHYGMITSEILSSGDIATVAKEVALTTSQTMSTTPSEYKVKPVLIENRLAVQIEIPLLDDSKTATLFQIIKYPTFAQGKKYIPDCDATFLAIYDNSNSYNELTTAEYADCSAKHKRCTATGPKMTSTVDHCAARQFFGITDKPSVFSTSPDTSPFFFTHNSQTLFSVPHPLALSFHCPQVDIAGPDHQLQLVERGNFTNPGDCNFNTDQLEYSPSNKIELDYSPPITSQFSTPKLPQLSASITGKQGINIHKTHVLDHLKPVDTDFTSWHATTIYTAAIGCVLLFIFFICLSYQFRKAYRKWRQPLRFMRDYCRMPQPATTEPTVRTNFRHQAYKQNKNDEDPTYHALNEAVNNHKSRYTDAERENVFFPKDLTSNTSGLTFNKHTVHFDARRNSLEEAIEAQEELDNLKLELHKLRIDPSELKKKDRPKLTLLIPPPNPETNPDLAHSPPPNKKHRPERNSFLNL